MKDIMAQNCKNPENTFAINFFYFLSVIVLSVSSFENVRDNLLVLPSGASLLSSHPHRLRHGHGSGLALPGRYARQTMTTSSNLTWPVKRSADVEGDILLGKKNNGGMNRLQISMFVLLPTTS